MNCWYLQAALKAKLDRLRAENARLRRKAAEPPEPKPLEAAPGIIAKVRHVPIVPPQYAHAAETMIEAQAQYRFAMPPLTALVWLWLRFFLPTLICFRYKAFAGNVSVPARSCSSGSRGAPGPIECVTVHAAVAVN